MTHEPSHGHTFVEPSPTAPVAGWYVDLSGSSGLRWWDGERWGPVAPSAPTTTLTPAPVRRAKATRTGEKSPAAAALLTLLWPGAGHRYLGLRKGTRSVYANGFGLVCWVSGFLWFIGLSIWLVTLCMSIGSIGRDTTLANRADPQCRPRRAHQRPRDI